MKVVIVGAGIGGLGAAVALNRAGHDVEVITILWICPLESKVDADSDLGLRKLIVLERGWRGHSPCS